MTGKIVSAICHGAYALSNAKFRNRTLIVEDELKETSAIFVTQKLWTKQIEIPENIITEQNQNSATLIAEKILEFL